MLINAAVALSSVSCDWFPIAVTQRVPDSVTFMVGLSSPRRSDSSQASKTGAERVAEAVAGVISKSGKPWIACGQGQSGQQLGHVRG